MRIAHFVIALMLFPGIKKLKAQTRIAFYTNYGNFEVTLNDSLAPITAGNFKKLVEEKFYDGVIFHRVIDGFMIQGGDPTGTGSGGPGYTIEDEFDSRLSNVQKTISMANSGPNTGGSQFFINLVNNTYLDYNKQPFTSKHPVFGIVTDSFEVVQRIGKVQTNGSNRPVNDVVMDSVRVVKEEGEPDYPSNGNFIVLGNPLTSDSRLLVRADSGEILKLQCMNIFGQLIWEQEVQIDRKELVLSLKSLYQAMSGNAVYILRQQIADRVSEIKLVKSELQ